MRRTLIIVGVALLVLVGLGALAIQPLATQMQKMNRPNWRTEEVAQGKLVATVNTTGTIKPVLSITVGSFVSGPILKMDAEFNQEVKKGDVLAQIDPIIYDANVARDEAALANREADVERVAALLWQAERDEKRAMNLLSEDETFIAQSEMDKFRFNRRQLAAQLKVAGTAIDQAKAALRYSVAQRDYTTIVAPEDGIIINRKIDPGQTVAAQFQTPELFIVAPDLRTKVQVHASVDEADIGLITAAKQRKLPVTFTVDAYPDEIFEGVVEEIRLSSTTTQNVVTYPVVCGAPNRELKAPPGLNLAPNMNLLPSMIMLPKIRPPDLMLLPGMTASLSFQVDDRADAIKIPNAALRFYPLAKHVRKEDKPLIEGQEKTEEEKKNEQAEAALSAQERADLRRKRSRRHVWVEDGNLLRAVEVVTGISDSHFTELVSGDIKPSDKLITGIKPKPAWGQ